MIYETARWADEAHTLVIGTDADGKTETVPADFTVFRCPDDGPVGFVNNGGVIADYEAPEPRPYQLFKSIFIRRMTVEEAGVLEWVLSNANAKLRMLFNSVEYFVSDDPLFAELHTAVSTALSPERADELLAAEG